MKQSKVMEQYQNNIGVLEEHPLGVKPRFKVGDRVQVRDMPYFFYTRSQMWARLPRSPTRTSSLRTKPSTWTAESNNITSFVFVRRMFGPTTHSKTIRYRPSPRNAGSSPSAN